MTCNERHAVLQRCLLHTAMVSSSFWHLKTKKTITLHRYSHCGCGCSAHLEQSIVTTSSSWFCQHFQTPTKNVSVFQTF